MTFIDTPGHALFSSMRAQGSSSTDLAIIVVAAEDGVQPQTLESLQLCQAAGVPIVIALTKIDLHPNPAAAAERIGHQLLESGVQVEAMGGEVPLVPISSMTGDGLDELKDTLALQAELLELVADPSALGESRVLESHQLKGLGVAADCIVTWGCVRVGDAVVVGAQHGRIKSLLDTAGARVTSMQPGFAVRIVGLATPPPAGEHILACESDTRAKQVAEWRARKSAVRRSVEDSARANAAAAADAERMSGIRNRVKRTASLRKRDGQRRYLSSKGEDIPLHLQVQPWEVALRVDLDAEASGGSGPGGVTPVAAELDRGRQVTLGAGVAGGPRTVPVLMRVDCSGSLDALHTALALIPDDEVRLKVVDTKVNDVSEGDIALARDLGASVLAFGVKVSTAVQRAAERAKVPIVQDRIIYSFVDKLADVLSAYLPAEKEARVTGRAVVQTVFPLNTSGAGKKGPSVIAGSRVVEGSITRGGQVRVLRGGEVVYKGPSLPSLQHYQERVDKVAKGEECGIGISNSWNDVEEGDVIEVVTYMTSRRRLTVDLQSTGAMAESDSEPDLE
jgi:translation initiation factor IF-2